MEVVKDNITTGRFFFIQSKGTIDSYNGGIISYSMSVERIRDYSQVQLPVLFVYYSKTEKRFWGRWMNSLYGQLNNEQKEQKTISIVFNDANEIDVDYLRNIGQRIELSITNQISLIIGHLPQGFKNIDSKIYYLISRYVCGDVTSDNHLCVGSIDLNITGTTSYGCVTVTYKKESISIPISLPTIDFLYYPNLNIQDVPQCLFDLLFVIAFFASSLSRTAREYVLSNSSGHIISLMPTDAWISFIFSIPDGDFFHIELMLDNLIKCEHYDIIQFIILRSFNLASSNKDYKDLYIRVLEKCFSGVIADDIKGSLCYNLGNYTREEDLYQAFSWYYCASKYEPDYLNRHYWWEELAGILYLSYHYRLAESFYLKAKMMGGSSCRKDIDMLISDCLVCQGRLEEAVLSEAKYIETSPRKMSEIVLRCNITKLMINKRIDCFNSRYWFNKGISYSNEDNHKEALNCFLFSWRLNDGDMEALSNAFIEAFNIGEFNLLSIIVCTMRELSPDDSFRFIVNTLLSDNNQLAGNNEALIDNIKSLLFSPLQDD